MWLPLFLCGDGVGIFSSKTVTTVGTSINRVVEDNYIPNSVKTGAFKSLVNNDGQFVANAMEELSNGLALRANRMYEYGKRSYMHGLPNSTNRTSKSGEDLVKQAIEEDYGPITIDYYHYGPLNTLHVGWMQLASQYAYDPATNALTVAGQIVFLTDMQVVIREATLATLEIGALDQWGTPPMGGATPERIAFPDSAAFTPFKTDPNSQYDYLLVSYCWKNADSSIGRGTFNIPITGYDEQADYHHVKFKNANGNTVYWLYKAGAGEHPAIDKLFTDEWGTGGTFFPFGYFRYGKKSLVDDETTEEYKHSKKLFKYLNIDYDTVGTAINENPDIADVESAMLMMAVPAKTTNQIELRYLFDFFDGLYQISAGKEQVPPRKGTNVMATTLNKMMDSMLNITSIVIQDKKFKMTINYRHIFKKKVTGVIGDIGTHAHSFGESYVKIPGMDLMGQKIEFHSPVKEHVYQRQITENVYEEISVTELATKFYVFEGYYVTADEDDDILLIPLDRSITKHYSAPKREELYARSLHYVFNSRVVTKVRWYQQGIFKWIIIIIAIIVSYFFPPAAYVALAAAAGVSVLVVIIVMNIIISMIFNIVVKVFVKLFGAKFAMLVAIIAIIYGGYQMIANGVQGAPFAADLMSLGNGLVSESIKVQMEDLKGDYEDFQDMVKTQEEKLEEAKSQLDYNNFSVPAFIFGETPDEYYQRTVHSGNIGVLALDAVTNYVDLALTLPKLNSTIGEVA